MRCDLSECELSKFAIFSNLTSRELSSVLNLAQEERYHANDPVIRASEQTSALYVIIDGSVTIESGNYHNFEGNPVTQEYATLRSGTVFGEIAFLGETRRSASVIANGELTVLKFQQADLLELFENDNRIGLVMQKNLSQILAGRLIETNFKLRDKTYMHNFKEI